MLNVASYVTDDVTFFIEREGDAYPGGIRKSPALGPYLVDARTALHNLVGHEEWCLLRATTNGSRTYRVFARV